MNPQVSVNFSCQRCHQHIHLDQGFSHLSELTVAELTLPIHAGSDAEFEGPKLDKITSPLKPNLSNGQTRGFNNCVGDSSENQKLPPAKVASKLFDLLSSNNEIDHPLCEECTDNILDDVDNYLERTEEQTLLYEKLFISETNYAEADTSELKNELDILQEEESRLLKELEEVESEEYSAQEVLHQCQVEKKRLDEEEDNYWREHCTHRCQVIALEDENRSLKSRIAYMQHQIEQLQQTNVFNATFHIWHSSYFGTINNLRLGRLPTVPVTWPEINAAWGQTVLLLSSLASKIGFTFTKYNLVPHGNTSYIEVKGEHKELPLYGSGGLRFLWDHKFDAGMAAFLECAAEFQKFIESNGFHDSRDYKKRLPYRINNHSMEDTSGQLYSIKMQFNSEEHWTKALKFLLVNLKWALTFISSIATEGVDNLETS